MDLNQLLASPTGQNSRTPPTPALAADTEEEPLDSGILSTVGRAGLAKHTWKHHTHDDGLASLW